MCTFALDLLAGLVDDPPRGQLQIDHVAVFQVDDLVGRAGQGQRVGGQEVLVLAQPDHQRRTLAGPDHAVRLVAAEHGDGVGALQAAHGLLHRLEQIARVQMVDQVRDHLGVGLAFEHVARALQFLAQLFVVLDDAVVHQRDARLVLPCAEKCGGAL